MGSESFWRTPVRYESFYVVMGMLWGILSHFMSLEWFWNACECSDWLSDVLEFFDVIQGIIVLSELFWNVPESFWGIRYPIHLQQFMKVPDGSNEFLCIQEVFGSILRRSEACLWVQSCFKNSWRFWGIFWCFRMFWGFPESSCFFRAVLKGSWRFSWVLWCFRGVLWF